jgi:hypothetical protein
VLGFEFAHLPRQGRSSPVRKLVAIALVAAGVLGTSGFSPSAKVTPHSCGSIGGEFLNVTVTNTTCKVAEHKVILFTMQGEKPPGWTCIANKPNGSNTHVTCRHGGGEAVAYTYHA